MEDKLYTVKEAAEILRITPRTVRHYLNIGKLKRTKLGVNTQSPVRIAESDIKKLIIN